MTELAGLSFPSSSSYTILDEIGRGGMGIVFLAEKDCEGVIDAVVLKTIRTYSPHHEETLKREANVATGLRHENIVKTYGLEAISFSALPDEFKAEIDTLSADKAQRRAVGRISIGTDRRARMRKRRLEMAAARRDDRRLYVIVMDYIEGTDLRTLHVAHLQRRLLLPCPLAAFVVSRICRALQYANEFLVHRDVSPENILLNAQGVAKLSDFGIAVSESQDTASFAGKLAYASPEQVGFEELDGRTDLYSLGLVLYQTLTGVSPQRPPPGLTFEPQLAHVRAAIQKGFPPPHAIRPDVPPALSEICMKMLARDRAQRYASAGDAGTDLEQKYLYAGGFGPTNNSMGAYVEIFNDGFRTVTREQAHQLAFLKGADGKYVFERKLPAETTVRKPPA